MTESDLSHVEMLTTDVHLVLRMSCAYAESAFVIKYEKMSVSPHEKIDIQPHGIYVARSDEIFVVSSTR